MFFLYSIYLSRFISLHSASKCSCVLHLSLHGLHSGLLCDAIILLFAGIILLLILIIVLHSLLFSLFMYSGLTFGTFPWFICSQCLVFYPRPVLAFGYGHRLRLWVCVSVCMYQSRASLHDNSSLIPSNYQARITKFRPEMQNTLV